MSDFETKGEPITYALAGRLCDALEELGKDLDTKVKVTKIICSEHLVARQTAKIYKDVVTNRQLFCSNEPDTNPDRWKSWLTPNKDNPEAINDEAIREICGVQGGNANPQTKPACILVGHQPDLTEIVRHLLKGKLPGDSLPLDGSEAACLRIGSERRLCWLITEKPMEPLHSRPRDTSFARSHGCHLILL